MKRYSLDSGYLENDDCYVVQVVQDMEGDYVQYSDAIEEIERLRAENARLADALRWEENRANRINVHNADCWKWGPSHYECALREIERLKAQPEVLQASEVTEPGYYWWRPDPSYDWHVAYLDWDSREDDGERIFISVILGEKAYYDWNNLRGEFRGPLPYPETDNAAN